MAHPESPRHVCLATTARAFWFATVLIFVAEASATEFGTKGGPEPANIERIAADYLRLDCAKTIGAAFRRRLKFQPMGKEIGHTPSESVR